MSLSVMTFGVGGMCDPHCAKRERYESESGAMPRCESQESGIEDELGGAGDSEAGKDGLRGC